MILLRRVLGYVGWVSFVLGLAALVGSLLGAWWVDTERNRLVDQDFAVTATLTGVERDPFLPDRLRVAYTVSDVDYEVELYAFAESPHPPVGDRGPIYVDEVDPATAALEFGYSNVPGSMWSGVLSALAEVLLWLGVLTVFYPRLLINGVRGRVGRGGERGTVSFVTVPMLGLLAVQLVFLAGFAAIGVIGGVPESLIGVGVTSPLAAMFVLLLFCRRVVVTPEMIEEWSVTDIRRYSREARQGVSDTAHPVWREVAKLLEAIPASGRPTAEFRKRRVGMIAFGMLAVILIAGAAAVAFFAW